MSLPYSSALSRCGQRQQHFLNECILTARVQERGKCCTPLHLGDAQRTMWVLGQHRDSVRSDVPQVAVLVFPIEGFEPFPGERIVQQTQGIGSVETLI